LTEEPSSSSQGALGHIRRLAGHSAIYGAADVSSQVINLLLTPLFVHYLSITDVGVIANLILLSAVARFVFRMGLDGGFLRLYYDHEDEKTRRDFTGSVVLFAASAGAVLLAVLAIAARGIGGWLLPGVVSSRTLVLLALADVYAGSFLFVPLHLLRIEGRAGRLAVLLTLRNLVNTVLKVVLVVQGFGVTGVLLSDLLATVALAAALLPVTMKHARPTIQRKLLAPVMAFGLPKAPHGVMIQLLNLADRKILAHFHGLGLVGIYDKGYGLGAGVKFALSAFEPAWQPFVFSRIGQPDAKPTLARVATYAWLAFVAFGLAVAVFAREALMLLTFTNRDFWAGAPIVPVVVLAYLLHGAFLLTSIGVAIEKKARYYPVMTAAAAAANLTANFLLIPQHGMLGAAWATVLAYAVMAALGFVFSRRLYPIPYEWGRVARISLAAVAVFGASRLGPSALVPSLVFKTGALLTFPILAWAMGAWTPAELDRVQRWLRKS